MTKLNNSSETPSKGHQTDDQTVKNKIILNNTDYHQIKELITYVNYYRITKIC